MREILGEEHPTVGMFYGRVGSLHKADGNFAEAQRCFEQTLKINRTNKGEESREVVESLLQLGLLLKEKKDYQSALTHFEESLQIGTQVLKEQDPIVLSLLDHLGSINLSLSEFEKARSYYEQAWKVNRKNRGEWHHSNVDDLNNLGSILQSLGDFSGALSYYEQALSINKKNRLASHAETKKSLSLISTLRREMEESLEPDSRLSPEQITQLRQAQKLYREADKSSFSAENRETSINQRIRALGILQTALGQEHPRTIYYLDEIGRLLVARRHLLTAQPYYEQRLKISEKVYGRISKETVVALIQLGSLLMEKGDYKGAQPYFEKSLQIKRDDLGPKNHELIPLLNSLGLILQNQRDFASARSRYEQALTINRKTYGEQHHGTADLLNKLGVLLRAQGEFTTAQHYFDQVKLVKNMEWTQESELPTVDQLTDKQQQQLSTAKLLQDEGEKLYLQGKKQEAHNKRKQALELLQEVLGKEHPSTYNLLYRLAFTLEVQRNYAESRSCWELLLKIKKNKMGDHPSLIISLVKLGSLATLERDYRSARSFYLQAFELSKRHFGEEHRKTASCLDHLGTLYKSVNQLTQAKSYYEQSLNIREKVFGKETTETAVSHRNLADTFRMQKDLDRAKYHYEHVLSIQKKVLGVEHAVLIKTIEDLGILCIARRDLAGARSYFQEAIELTEKVWGQDSYNTTALLTTLFNLESGANNFEKASKLQNRVQRNRIRYIGDVLSSLSAKEQLRYLRSKYAQGFHRAISLGFSHRTHSVIAEDSAIWLINGKAISQSSLARRNLLMRDALTPQLEATIQKLIATQRSLANLAITQPEPGQEESRKQLIAKLSSEELTLTRQITRATGRQLDSVDPWVTLERLREAIGSDEILIEIVRFRPLETQPWGGGIWQPDRYAAWIIPPAGSGNVEIVDLGLANELDSAISKANLALSEAAKPDALVRREGDLAAIEQIIGDLSSVAELAWKPLADKIPSGTKQLILSPDGALWLLPWTALPIEKDRYLIEEYSVRFEVTGRALVHETGNAGTTTAPMIFADPDYDLDSRTTRDLVQSLFPKLDLQDNSNQGASSQAALPKVERLPNTKLEAAAVAPNMAKVAETEPKQVTGKLALETALKQVRQPEILMLSTHGFFLPDLASDQKNASSQSRLIENPLLRCGLMLAGCNSRQSSGVDDGVFTGMEVVSMDLRGTEMVVLSACETGIGRVNSGEGVAGLRQAFQLAGAESVIATLWQVPDRDSALIMNEFFANLAAGESRADSLRNAQLKRIESRRNRFGAAHPFFWAAWTLTGK